MITHTAIAAPDPDDDGIPERFRKDWEQYKKLSDNELNEELAQSISVTALHFVKMALLLRVKEQRGHDLSELRLEIKDYLRKVAFSQLNPEVLVRFGSYPNLLKIVAAMALPDQQKCLNALPVAIIGDDGRMTTILRDLRDLTPSLRRQVLGADHVRSPEEQAAWLRTQQLSRSPVARKVEPLPYTIAKHKLVVDRGALPAIAFSKRELQRIIDTM